MTNDKMIYDDARSIGLDYETFKKFESLFNNHNNDDEPEVGDFTIKGNKLFLWAFTKKN